MGEGFFRCGYRWVEGICGGGGMFVTEDMFVVLGTWADAIPDWVVYVMLGGLLILVILPFLCVGFILKNGGLRGDKAVSRNKSSGMNLILRESRCVDCFTYLDELFRGVPRLQDYYFLLSDLEVTGWPVEESSIVVSGSELFRIIEGEKVQFIWGVLSAFKEEPVVPAELPFADGNEGVWVVGAKPQCVRAEFEIVCWDSSSTLFIGVDEELGAELREFYPDIQCLDEFVRGMGD